MQELITELRQPVTIKQWSRMSGIIFEQCRQIFVGARRRMLIRCINPAASRHRLYFFTVPGLKRHRQIRSDQELEPVEFDLPEIDWNLYGQCCYAHRSTVIKTLQRPMQPATARRIAVRNDPKLKMSSGNTRDVIYWLRNHGIVSPVREPKNPYFLYELTVLGEHIRRLLKQADVWL